MVYNLTGSMKIDCLIEIRCYCAIMMLIFYL